MQRSENDTVDAINRLRSWIRDYGDQKQPYFIRDLEVVLDIASEAITTKNKASESSDMSALGNVGRMIKPRTINETLVKSAMADMQRLLERLAGEFTVEHLLAAEPWSDRLECLKWAVENVATVAEMKAWHRAQNGLDLFAE